MDQNSISFPGLPAAETLVPKPDCSGSDSSSERTESGTEACQEPLAICFLIKKLSISFRAHSLYKTTSFFPFYACTLRFLVPRCCRVTLQPGLLGQNSISFPGLLGAESFVPKPDWSEHPDFSIGAIANGRTEARQRLPSAHFQIPIKNLRVSCIHIKICIFFFEKQFRPFLGYCSPAVHYKSSLHCGLFITIRFSSQNSAFQTILSYMHRVTNQPIECPNQAPLPIIHFTSSISHRPSPNFSSLKNVKALFLLRIFRRFTNIK